MVIMSLENHNEKFTGNILLAEPNLVNQVKVEDLLERYGVHATIVNKSRDVIGKCQQNNYDIILLDMSALELNGLETTQALINNGCVTPIVALAANATSEDKKQYQRAGCAAFLSTPINHAHFVAVLACYLEPMNEELNPVYSTLLKEEPDMDDLVSIFLEKLPGMIAGLHKVVKVQDMVELGHILHNLKAIGTSYGFPQLSEISKAMELTVLDENHQEMHSLLGRFDSLCERIIMGGINDGLVKRYA